ncbi:CheW-like domain-containing protein [Marinococcus luteus]|uniref:CheW-like domain-containing protein n=1 Tax=Marinococcus luteus TaxID=1122204 RepID=A0A1H2R3J9_9BACI|nr:chemotaxis protein [Marinococcus luteus]SDW14013.1 CheW-like domain-containing protein [Marinococcus luteus]
MSLASEKHILLESGTNELEIVLFSIGTSQFGINVLKVREIIHQVEVTPVPNRHEHVKEIIRIRNKVIPVIDLKKVLHHDGADDDRHDKYIIAELNQVKAAFHVEEVSRIHRISNLPVIIFSSLVTADLFHKGEKVGADAQVSNPEINTLVKTIDSCLRAASGR